MRTPYLLSRVAVGLATLAFIIGLGLALSWLLYFRESLVGALSAVGGLAVAVLVLAIGRHRASMGWTVLFLAAFSLLLVSTMSPLGIGPFLGPAALLLLGLSLWILLRPRNA